MKISALCILALILCLTVPCAAAAEPALPDEGALHAAFTLGLGLHADGFPQSGAHLRDWETFLKRLDVRGVFDGQTLLQPESRVYMEAAVCIGGEEKLPFTYDGYGSYRYLIGPMFGGDSVLFQMHNFLEFMLKPYYFMELQSQYLALFLYPAATSYIAESFYAPVSEMITEARGDVLTKAGNVIPIEITYHIPYERLLALCEELNAVTTGDTKLQRVSRYCDALLMQWYVSDVVVDALSHFEVFLEALDSGREGMTVRETANGMVCTLGGLEVFSRSAAGGVTEIAFQMPVPPDGMITFAYRCETTGGTHTVSAAAALTNGEESLVSMSIEGEGLPAEDTLSGKGSVTVEMDGSMFEEPPVPLTLAFGWSRTAAELPCDLDLAVDWIHPQTNLPAFSVYFSGALEARESGVFIDNEYPIEDFFSLNESLLQEYKERWGASVCACLIPVALEMPLGVIDDIVNFMLDKDILISVIE